MAGEIFLVDLLDVFECNDYVVMFLALIHSNVTAGYYYLLDLCEYHQDLMMLVGLTLSLLLILMDLFLEFVIFSVVTASKV